MRQTRFLVLLTLFVLCPVCWLSSQCPITVNAGPDQVVCNAGESTTLNGSVSGAFLGFSWSPAAGLDNPFSLTPNATVTGPQTYTLTGFAVDPFAPNLVVNPAFEAQNSGFSSAFTFTPAPITPGTYVMTTSPSLVFSNFPPCDDHTFGNGTGYMMLVNGTGSAGANVWCQTIAVNPNTYYSMSAWATSSPISPPLLQFSVNGTLVGSPYSVSGTPCNWEQFSATWFSGPATSALLCITDQNNSGNGLFGDDFALDDVYFAEACAVSDEVSVSVVTVDAVLPGVTILPCSAAVSGIQLNGSASTTGPGISYNWTTNGGNIMSGGNSLTPVVNAEGTYTLIVSFTNGSVSCTDEASIEVLPDPDIVLAFAQVYNDITCLNPTVVIDGSGTSTGPGIQYEWSPALGIASGGNTPSPEVEAAGAYTLVVTNSSSGCTATTQVIVQENTTPPVAVANVSGLVSCIDTIQTLSGAGSSTGPEFSYQWQVVAWGNIVSGANTLNNCIVDTAGIYSLTVTNIVNGCTAIAFVSVGENTVAPNASALVQNQIDCLTDTTLLDGSGSTGNNLAFLWTTQDGHILSGDSSEWAVADEGGTYILIVTNQNSGCTDTDTVLVMENSVFPVALVDPPAQLNCLADSVQLQAGNSSQGTGFGFSWSTQNGNISSGGQSLFPFVNLPGDYTLIVLDSLNGCRDTATVTVLQNTTAPVAEAGPSAVIDCVGTPVLLEGAGSSQGGNFEYLWTTMGGNFLAGENSLTPEINAPGIYFLSVIDTTNGCQSLDSVVVVQDGNAPVAVAMVSDTLDCLTGSLLIDATASSSGANIQISWTTLAGSILSGQNTLTPEVGAPGVYTLTLLDQSNNCTASTSIEVVQDTLAPVVSLLPPPVLNCLNTADTLFASAGGLGTGLSFQWTTLDGNILTGANTSSPEINESGTYVVQVSSAINGCLTMDSVSVSANFSEPFAEAGNPLTLTCDDPAGWLDGSLSSQGTDIIYSWTTAGGNILYGSDSLAVEVNSPGVYFLAVTDGQNGCQSIDSVEVDVFADLPVIDLPSPDTLDCIHTELMLNAGVSNGTDFTYSWTTPDGNILAGDNTLTPTVNAPGSYTLTVINTGNGCVASQSVEVVQQVSVPLADAGSPFTLSCSVTNAVLDGSGSSTGPSFSYLWTTPNGNIIGGNTTLAAVINAPGIYILSVTDLETGCEAADSVVVQQDAAAPVAVAGQQDTLSCLVTSLLLNGSGSSTGPALSYLWTTTDGNILSGANTLAPLVDQAGTYLLAVTDAGNGCQTLASVQIIAFTEIPDLQLPPPAELTCIQTEAILTIGVGNGPAQFAWTTLDGNIVSGQFSSMPLINEPGTYVLTATNSASGCATVVNIEVTENISPPQVSAEAPNALGCGQDQVSLDGTGSSTGPSFVYAWTTQDGNILSGASTLFPLVNAPGTYVLTVTDLTNGCVAIDSVALLPGGNEPFVLIASPDEITCINEQITLDGSASVSGLDYALEWTTFSGNFVSGQQTLTPLVDAPGLYILTITNMQNGCTASDSVTVLTNTATPPADAGPDQNLDCDQQDVILVANPGNTAGFIFSWSFLPAPGITGDPFVSGQFSPESVVNLPGQYILTVTGATNGCTAVDQVVVTSSALLDFDFDQTDPGCEVPFGTLVFSGETGGTPPFLYSVDGGLNFTPQNTFTGLPAGTYELVVRDDAGCEVTKPAVLQEVQSLFLSLETEISLFPGETYRFQALVNVPESELNTILWSPAEGLDCTTCLDPVVTAFSEMTYTLQIQDVNGCAASASVNIFLKDPPLEVFVPNVFSPNGDGVNDGLVIFASQRSVARLTGFRIFSRWGESVFERFDFPPNDFSFAWDGTHRGKDLDPGVYVWFAEVELLNGEKKILEGSVQILR